MLLKKNRSQNKKIWIFLIFFFFFLNINVQAKELEIGKKLFLLNCNVCHKEGTNVIIPEKNLKKETLERNGMNTLEAIIYQITNGKNGMPAFGGRLKQEEIENIASYVLDESYNNFEK